MDDCQQISNKCHNVRYEIMTFVNEKEVCPKAEQTSSIVLNSILKRETHALVPEKFSVYAGLRARLFESLIFSRTIL